MSEADRRFAFLVAMMTPDHRRGVRSRRREGGDAWEETSASDEPADDERQESLGLESRSLIIWLFIGCALAATLFIVAASFIRF